MRGRFGEFGSCGRRVEAGTHLPSPRYSLLRGCWDSGFNEQGSGGWATLETSVGFSAAPGSQPIYVHGIWFGVPPAPWPGSVSVDVGQRALFEVGRWPGGAAAAQESYHALLGAARAAVRIGEGGAHGSTAERARLGLALRSVLGAMLPALEPGTHAVVREQEEEREREERRRLSGAAGGSSGGEATAEASGAASVAVDVGNSTALGCPYTLCGRGEDRSLRKKVREAHTAVVVGLLRGEEVDVGREARSRGLSEGHVIPRYATQQALRRRAEELRRLRLRVVGGERLRLRNGDLHSGVMTAWLQCKRRCAAEEGEPLCAFCAGGGDGAVGECPPPPVAPLPPGVEDAALGSEDTSSSGEESDAPPLANLGWEPVGEEGKVEDLQRHLLRLVGAASSHAWRAVRGQRRAVRAREENDARGAGMRRRQHKAAKAQARAKAVKEAREREEQKALSEHRASELKRVTGSSASSRRSGRIAEARLAMRDVGRLGTREARVQMAKMAEANPYGFRQAWQLRVPRARWCSPESAAESLAYAVRWLDDKESLLTSIEQVQVKVGADGTVVGQLQVDPPPGKHSAFGKVWDLDRLVLPWAVASGEEEAVAGGELYCEWVKREAAEGASGSDHASGDDGAGGAHVAQEVVAARRGRREREREAAAAELEGTEAEAAGEEEGEAGQQQQRRRQRRRLTRAAALGSAVMGKAAAEWYLMGPRGAEAQGAAAAVDPWAAMHEKAARHRRRRREREAAAGDRQEREQAREQAERERGAAKAGEAGRERGERRQRRQRQWQQEEELVQGEQRRRCGAEESGRDEAGDEAAAEGGRPAVRRARQQGQRKRQRRMMLEDSDDDEAEGGAVGGEAKRRRVAVVDSDDEVEGSAVAGGAAEEGAVGGAAMATEGEATSGLGGEVERRVAAEGDGEAEGDAVAGGAVEDGAVDGAAMAMEGAATGGLGGETERRVTMDGDGEAEGDAVAGSAVEDGAVDSAAMAMEGAATSGLGGETERRVAMDGDGQAEGGAVVGGAVEDGEVDGEAMALEGAATSGLGGEAEDGAVEGDDEAEGGAVAGGAAEDGAVGGAAMAMGGAATSGLGSEAAMESETTGGEKRGDGRRRKGGKRPKQMNGRRRQRESKARNRDEAREHADESHLP